MREVSRVMALVVAVVVLGCSPASERDLVGTWQITDDSRERLPKEYRKAAGTLSLAADGRFTALEVPVFVGQSDDGPWPAERKPALLTGSGTWALGRSGGQMLNLSIEAGSEGYPGILPYGYLLSIYPTVGEFSLVDYWGDPDAVPGIFFSKTERQPEP